jgi:hypothetical protein
MLFVAPEPGEDDGICRRRYVKAIARFAGKRRGIHARFDRHTPQLLAIEFPRCPAFEALLQTGAEPNALNPGEMPRLVAAVGKRH